MSTSILTATTAPIPTSPVVTGLSSSSIASEHVNHKVKIFLPCHYDLSQVETCAPFLDRYGGVVFVYDWNVAKDAITDYYRRQYSDGWVKVMPFSLRNILDAIKNLDHRLHRYDNKSQLQLSATEFATSPTSPISLAMAATSPATGSNSSLNTLASTGSSNSISSNYHVEARKQYQVVFLLTGCMNPDYGVFGPTQKMIMNAVKGALPERVRAVNIIGQCMYGCASCSGVEHKVPLYFTRYFNKTLSYTAQDVLSLYTVPRAAPTFDSPHVVYKMEDVSSVEQVELENVKFILANFTVAREEHVCLCPFMEAFDVVIADLHSSVPFIASYFTPKVILSYFNDADYGTTEGYQEFMDQLNAFVKPEELEALLNNLPEPKGDPSFFHSQYGHVDGKEDLRFGNLAGWPTEQFEPSQPFQYRQAMAQIALKWRDIYKNMIKTYPDDIGGANNALGFHAKFPLLKDEEIQDVPMTLPRILPREQQAAGIELRIMSFNIWNGGLSGGQALEQTAKAILTSGADVVGLQECSTVIEGSGSQRNMLPELMKYLPGWYYSDQKLRSASMGPRSPWGIVSKFPIVSTTKHGFGVKIQLNNHRHPEIESLFHELPEDQYPPVERFHSLVNGVGRSENSFRRGSTSNMNTRFMYLFNCHLCYYPYQPFQLLKIPYGQQPFLKTADEAIQSCIDTRGAEMNIILDEIQKVAEEEQDVPIFLTGDFNEPSHLDWTPLAIMAGLQPMTVKWPMTQWAYKHGLVDLWRAFRPRQRIGSG
ncbi:hypothetical protein BGZ65_006700, partial [Modicella reniformis]